MAARRIPASRWINGKVTEYEDDLQINCIKWLFAQYPNIPAFHVPNGGSRNKIEGRKLKMMGVRRGVPDVFIDLPRGDYHGARFELKTGRNGMTAEQAGWMQYYREHGFYAQEVRSLDEFVNAVNFYMSL